MPIRACPDCGSDRLTPPKGGASHACIDCSWTGTPNEFGSWAKWQEFRVAVKANRPTLTA